MHIWVTKCLKIQSDYSESQDNDWLWWGKRVVVASQLTLVVKNPPANAGDARDAGLIPGSRRSPEGGHGNHSSILAWEIPWTEEPGGLQSIESERVRHDWATQHSTAQNHVSQLFNYFTSMRERGRGRGRKAVELFVFILLCFYFNITRSLKN